MYIVYSTTKSSELYPDKVLIVVGEPGVAEKLPERLVVIPTSWYHHHHLMQQPVKENHHHIK